MFEKLSNYGHHNEFEESGITVENIKNSIKNKKHRTTKLKAIKVVMYKTVKLQSTKLQNYKTVKL